ncbi:ATP-binding protein, partial [Streptomyces mayteni]
MAARERPETRMSARAGGAARVYAAGRDQHIHHAPPPPPPSPALRTLPRDVPAFTGRRAEAARLLSAADGVTDQAGQASYPIHTVDGMPGVGKTALVVHVAQRLAEHFPDGQLFLRLHAHTPGRRPVPAADALAQLLLGVGVDPRSLPEGVDARAALWRDWLAGRRALLVLDDAADQAQLDPLLPGAPGCLVLVTSRRRLAALDGATPLSLEPPPPDEAALLFTRLAHRPPGTATPGDAAAVAELVALSGRLPLALVLLAGRLAHQPHASLPEFAARFAAATDRLGELVAGDRAVRAAFDMSYAGLPPERRLVFRALGLHPGPETDPHATAALVDLTPARARAALEALHADHLVDAPAPGRYRPHDLLRGYARVLAEHDPPADRAAAVDRLLDHYRHVARAADRLLPDVPHPETATPTTEPATARDVVPELPDSRRALAWMRAERGNLVACVGHAAATGRYATAVELTAALAAFLRRQGPFDEAAGLQESAAAIARLTGDRLGEAGAVWDLGRTRYLTGDVPLAIGLLRRALGHYRALGERLGEAGVLRDLGRLCYLAGDRAAAVEALERAPRLYGELGNVVGEAGAWWQLGWLRAALGDHRAAVEPLERALDGYRALGDAMGEGAALWQLGWMRAVAGDHRAATELLDRARALYREQGNRIGEANALRRLGRVRRLAGDLPAARRLADEALESFRDLGNPQGEASALHDLGRLAILTGEHRAADELLRDALARFRDLGDRQAESEALNSVGDLLAATGSAGEALASYRRALDLARRVSSPLDAAHALEGTGRCQARLGDERAARAA